MAKKKVLVTGIVSKTGLTELFEKFDVTYSDNEFSREYILKNLGQYDALLLMGQKGDKELIDAGKNLKIISINGVGYNHVDIDYAKTKGVKVANSPQAVRVPTAEMTLSLILSSVKRLKFYDDIVARGEWIDPSVEKYQGNSLTGKTLGVYGMGRIGQTVAQYAKAFGMHIIYNDAFQLNEKKEKELDAKYVSFEDLLKCSDVITIHAPLLDSTKGIFNLQALKKMKNSAYLINAARGPIVVEKDLVEALENHEIAGAGLDVFEFEPKVSERLRSMSNVIMTPHAGTGTIEARAELAKESANNIIQFFNGNEINILNK